jgi:hypothetical protein
VGFGNGSLELPADPLLPLSMVATYYRAHPEHEAAVFDLTAANAEAVNQALLEARSAVDAAHSAEAGAKRARDAAFKQLRGRITLLREELTLLLPPDDSRWYRFGFRRPVDGETPDLVEKVELREAGESIVVAEWPRSRLAENYRVSWKEAGSTAEPTELGLFKDRTANLRDLPRGGTIVVRVTARNAAGESAATESEITLPERVN